MSSPRPRRYDLIAFDWDGTLFDSTRIITRCIQEAVRDVGGVVPDDQAASYVIGMALIPALAHAAPDVPKEKYPELGARYRHHYLQHKDEMGVAPDRTLMIGDTTHDLEMARRAGCDSIGVSYGAHHHDNFDALSPRCVAHSVAELQHWLLTHG